MPSSTVLDASVLVAAVLPSEPGHSDSARLLALCARNRILLVEPSIAIPEVLGAVIRRTRRSRLAREIVEQYRANSVFTLVPVDVPLAEAAGDIAVHQALRGADAVYLALASELEITLVTLDKEQFERSPRSTQVFTPQQALAAWSP